MQDELAHFIAAQDEVWDSVRAELAAGAKRTHWMWFVFPQIAGLGLSDMSQRYAIADLNQARAYLAHPILAHRLYECVNLALASGRSAMEIFGPIDAQKFFSSMTLFAYVAVEPIFEQALAQFFCGARDQATLTLAQMG